MRPSAKVQAFEGEVAIDRGKEAGFLEEVPSRGRAAAFRLLLARLALLVAILALWEAAAGSVIDKFWISEPSDIAARLARWGTSGALVFHLRITLTEMLLGLAWGASAGIAVGFVLGRNPFLAKLLDPFIIAIYSLPKIALAPLFILWFGIDIKPKIILAAVIVFFLVFYNTYSGVRDVDQELLDVVRIMGGGRWDLLFKVVLPSSLAWIFTGLKIAVPYALIGAIVGEIMASNKGIGYLIEASAGQFDTAGVFASLFILMVVATSINEVVGRSEAVLLRWKVVGR